MQEIWKDIQGYESLYQASNLSRIRSLDRIIYYSDGRINHTKGKIINSYIDSSNGYSIIRLSKNNKIKRYKVHRIIAKLFLDNPNKYVQINHKDCNKTNNNIENLEWCNQSQNMKHAFANNLIKRYSGIENINSKLDYHIVSIIRKSILSCKELANIFNVSEGCIKQVKKFKTWKYQEA
jgi:hypothetical protein